jgi:hypothetical protein
MALTIDSQSYVADSFQKDVVLYIGPAKTVSVKDDLKLSRQAPKATSDFSGLARTSCKLTRTLTLTGALTPTADVIVTIDVAVPVGYTAADVDEALDDAGEFLASASFKTHVKSQKISF